MISKLLSLPFKICNKYYKLLKVLKKQTISAFLREGLLLGAPPIIFFGDDDFVIVSILAEDNDYDYNYNITHMELTFSNYDKHRNVGKNLLIDNNEAEIQQVTFPDFHLICKKENDNVLNLITKDEQELFSNYLYDEDHLSDTFYLAYNFVEDLSFATNDYYVFVALKDFLSKVNKKEILRIGFKAATVFYYIE